MKKWLAGFLVITFTLAPLASYADGEQATVHFKVYSPTDVIYDGNVVVHPCPETLGSATSTLNGYCIFGDAGVATEGTWYDGMGYAATTIGGATASPTDWWQLFVNGAMSDVGISGVVPHDGDTILWTTGREPMIMTVSSTSPSVGATTTITVKGFNIAGYPATIDPIAGATVLIGETSYTSDIHGLVEFIPSATTILNISATATGFIPSETLTITPVDAPTTTPAETSSSTPPTESVPTGSTGGGFTHRNINIPRAVSFLVGAQQADGSFGSSLYTDWAAIGLATESAGAARTALRTYLASATPVMSSITDYERHAMALQALGIDPYTGTQVNYIMPIITAFDGVQVGETTLINDDVFALLPLIHAGYTADDTIIQKVTAYVVGAQLANGSWDNSVDMTAASVQALTPLTSLPGVSDSITKAILYLHTQQQQDGGFGNTFSTSWAMQAIRATGGQTAGNDWMPAGLTTEDYLFAQQADDGGMETIETTKDTRVWATSYALPAASGKDWHMLLSSFNKPTGTTTPDTTSTSGGAFLSPATTTATSSVDTAISTSTATSTAATSTPDVATTTPPVATTTPTTTPQTVAPVPKTPAPVFAKTPVKKTVAIVKKPTPSVAPAPTTSTSSQTASAAVAAPQGGFFSKLWKFITSLF